MMPRGGSDNIIAIHGCRRCLIKPKSKSKSLIQYLIFGILKILSWWWHLEFTWEGLYYCQVVGGTPLGAFSMLGRCSFLSIFDIWDRSSQRQFEDSELVVAP